MNNLSLRFLPACLLAFTLTGAAYAQISAGELDNVAIGKQLLEDNDLWGAKDHLEREQLARPNTPGLAALLDETYGRLAVRSLADSQPAQALAFADKALAIRPDQVELIYTRARSHESLKDHDQAIAGYEETLRLNGGADYNNSQPRLIYLYKVRGQAFLQKGELQASKADFTSLAKLAPDDTDANYFLGYIALQEKDYARARAYFDVSLEDERLLRMTQLYYGIVEAESQDWPAAIKWHTEARKEEPLRPQTDPYLAAAYYNLGVRALAAEMLDEADDNFQSVLRLDAAHIDALFNLGMTWDKKGGLERSREYYVKVRELRPGHRQIETVLADVNHRIGVGHFEAKRFEKAHDLLTQAAALDAQRGEPHYYLGLVHRQWKEDDKALPEFEIAIARNAYVKESQFEAGEVLFGMKDWPRSIAYLERVESSDPAFRAAKVKSYLRESWWKLALADVQDQRWPEADDKLKKVLKYPPDLPETHYFIGLAALRQGFYDTAIAELGPAYKQMPKHVDARKALAEAHYQLGVAAFVAGRNRDADKDLMRAHEIDRDNRDTQYQMARNWVILEKYAAAIPYLEKLAGMKPPFRESRDELAKAYGGYAEQLIDKKRAVEARRYLDLALKINPGELSALYGMGSIALDAKRYAEAAEFLAKVNERSPDYRRNYPKLVDAYWNLGRIAYDKKAPMDAHRWLSKVVDLDPNHGEALFHLGDIEVNAKNYEQAKSYFERAINRQTKLVESHYGLGSVLYELGEYAASIEHFEETIRLKPQYKNADSYLRRAIYNEADKRYRAGDEMGSATYYARYFELEPKSAEIALKLAAISEKAGMFDQTMSWYEKAIPIVTGDADPVRFKLAMLAYKTKQYERALKAADRIKSADGKQLKGTIYLTLGKRDRSAGNLPDAMVNLKLAILLLPDNPEVLYEYGMTRYGMGDMREAAQYLADAVDRDPALPEGQRLTADAHRKVAADAFAKERLKEADRFYKASLKYEESIEANYHIGVIAVLRKDLPTAYEWLQKAAAENPRYQATSKYIAEAVCSMGEAALARQDYPQAKIMVAQCARYNPSNWEIRYNLATMAFKAEDYDEARGRFTDIVLNTGRRFPEAANYLLDSLYALQRQAFDAGDFEKSRAYSEEVLERSPDSYRAYLSLAVSLEKLNRPADAMQAVRKALEMRPGANEAVELWKRLQPDGAK